MSFETKKLHVDCTCLSPEHIMRFMFMTYKPKKGPAEYDLTAEMQLGVYLPWYKRIIPGLKYIFGIEDPQGGWASTMFTRNSAVQLKQLLEEYLATPDTEEQETPKENT